VRSASRGIDGEPAVGRVSKHSAGILPYRWHQGTWQVLLAHPGGPFWARKDAGAWSVAKGEYLPPESPLAAALREFEEETGQRLTGPFVPLQSVRLKSGKVIEAFATESDWDLSGFHSNLFEIVDAKGVARQYPEVDRVEWFALETAAHKIHPGQLPFLARLQDHLAAQAR
jgi:predicted NUDIX family NTP pyrophosphohydrolase